MNTFATLPSFYLFCPKWVKLSGTSLGSLAQLETTDLVRAPPWYPWGMEGPLLRVERAKLRQDP